jgi:hypothetical protein
VRIDFSAFPREGAEFQERFRERVTNVTRPERTEAFWSQAAPVFRNVFNDFGAHPSTFQLMRSDGGLVEYMTQNPTGGQIGNLEDLYGQGIPKPLQSTARNGSLPQRLNGRTPSHDHSHSVSLRILGAGAFFAHSLHHKRYLVSRQNTGTPGWPTISGSERKLTFWPAMRRKTGHAKPKRK